MEDLSVEKDAAMRLSESLRVTNDVLRSKNEEMEQFVYIVSHDLKSPLVTISGFSKKLAQELAGQLNEKQQHRLKRIQDNIDH